MRKVEANKLAALAWAFFFEGPSLGFPIPASTVVVTTVVYVSVVVVFSGPTISGSFLNFI